MRIRSLTLRGIGPFAGEHAVDFSAFDQSGLFLLEGPTGSGKSSIIDALMFALYGRVSGNLDQAEQRLRSTYCADDQPSSVSLLFETASGIYEVVRTPGYQPGNRKTPKPATVRLDRVTVDEDGAVASREGIAVKKAEVDQEILGLVGLDANQFRQTVVLPQGDFSAFLMARSEERRKILQDIFGTGLYQEIQAYLQQEARDSRERVRIAQSRAEGQLDSLLKTLGDELGEQPLPLDQLDVDALHTRFAAVEVAAEERERGLAADLEKARARAEASRSLLIAAERAEESVRQRRDVETTLAGLERELPAIEEAGKRLAAARRAGDPSRKHAAWQKAAEEESKAKSRARDLTQEVEETLSGRVGDAIASEESDAREPAALLHDIAQQRGGLRELLGREEEATRLAKEIGRLQKQRDALRNRERETGAAASLIDREREAAQATLDGGPQLLEDERNLTVARRAAELADRIHGAEATCGEAAEAARRAGRHEGELRDRWLADSAGAIAAELRSGEPCPVCGSEHHPHPAAPGGDPVSLEAVNRAGDRRREADAALQEAAGALVQLRTERELLGEVPDCGDLAQRQIALAERRADHDRAAATLERTAGDLTSLAEELQTLALKLVRAESNLADARRQLTEIQEAVAARSHPFQSIREKDAALEALHRQVGALAEAKHDAQAASERALRSLAELEEAAEAAGYPASAEGYRQIATDALSEVEMQDLAESISAHRARMGEVKNQLKELRADREIEARAESLPRLRVEHLADQQATDESQRALAEWSAHVRALRQQLGEADALIGQWQRESERAAPAIRLASLANASAADNLLKMPLASYVLTRRLDEVIEATNPRLRDFSNHHYELVRQAEGRDGNRKTGLGLEILDNETGRRRPPGTLSGGEVFYTSLALALGLAEIVTAEAGGFDLGTVFIDEGFGSLDAETLDVVMKHLEELRSGGRTVGVVSHVAEMQTRIAEGIRVRRLGPGKGSTLAMRC